MTLNPVWIELVGALTGQRFLINLNRVLEVAETEYGSAGKLRCGRQAAAGATMHWCCPPQGGLRTR
jgi:hypothetical protein